MSKRWYVVHAYSGFESQVKRSLEERIKRYGMEDKFGDILVPTEEVVEMREGQKPVLFCSSKNCECPSYTFEAWSCIGSNCLNIELNWFIVCNKCIY